MMHRADHLPILQMISATLSHRDDVVHLVSLGPTLYALYQYLTAAL